MSFKILLADDSLTIQKVVKITLANLPFDIVDCSSEDELLKELKKSRPDLVLLDFSLSERRNGHELAKEIIGRFPDCPILMMYGTFDVIDEKSLKECGVNDKVVKPFDSMKFIQICKKLTRLEDVPLSKKEGLELIKEELIETSEWVVNSPTPKEQNPSGDILLDAEDRYGKSQDQNELILEIEDWGIEIPSIVSSEQPSQNLLPPIIGGMENEEKFEHDHTDTIDISTIKNQYVYPHSTHLEYPDTPEKTKAAITSKLVPMSDLKLDGDESLEIEPNGCYHKDYDKTDVAFQLSRLEEDHLGDYLKDEINSNDFWTADEIVKATPISTPAITPEIRNTRENPREQKEWKSFLSDPAFELELRYKIRNIVEDVVREYCQEAVGKIAWEIIPDLAENLIKHEIGKISDSVLDEE